MKHPPRFKPSPASPWWALVMTLGLATPGWCQDLPDTDIFHLTVEHTGTEVQLGTPRNLTNRPGYDNQPFFLPGGTSFLYTASSEGQTDIYRLDLDGKKPERLTHTSESEYSPTPFPGLESQAFSVVRVEKDDRQRLWRFSVDGGKPDVLLAGVEPVGYHVWGDSKRVALFVLGEPPTLQWANLETDQAETLVKDIGRSLHRIPGKKAFSFVHKESAESWWIKRYDIATGQITTLLEARPGKEDVTWSPTGELWATDDHKLFRWRPGDPEGWRQVADLSTHQLEGLTRLTFDSTGRHLLVVAQRGENLQRNDG